MKIITIDDRSSYLPQIVELADANAATLGFMPRKAFISKAAQNRVLCALGEDEEFLGYLLYEVNRREGFVYITHLCVKRSERHNGVATKLFNELKLITRDKYRGIRVHCRRDYNLSRFWERLGFIAKGEKQGRGQNKSTWLTIWWVDYGYPTLFDYADEQRAQSKLKVAIDANIFYRFQEPSTPENIEVQSLLADWLLENVELCLTSEIFNEIDRYPGKPAERQRKRDYAYNFFRLSPPEEKVQEVTQNLRPFFPQEMTNQDESDFRHLAKTISAGVQFFVTRDGSLLEKAEDIYENFGLHIIRPSDLIINQDLLMREAEYQPARLAGSLIKIERVQSEHKAFSPDVFRLSQNETKRKFTQRLQSYLASPHNFRTELIQSADQPLGLIIYGGKSQHELVVPMFRVTTGTLSSTLARYLVHHLVLTSSSQGLILTKITDPYLSNVVSDALRESGFVFIQDTWIKANLRLIETSEKLISRLTSLSQQLPQAVEYFEKVIQALSIARSTDNTSLLLETERSLWPAKIADINIPTFVVAIQPQWAMHLFDKQIADQDLFGGNPTLLFNIENVYYRSSHQKQLSAPARVLWYVSKGKGKYQDVMSIKACSYLDEVVVDKPKILYSQFRRLGVYQWQHVFSVANKDLDQEIMAFRFSYTELFKEPISRDDLQKIWQVERNSNFNVIAPTKISNELFLQLYKMGVQIDEEVA